MGDFFGLFGTLTAADSALLSIVFAIGALFVATVAFSCYAIVLRIGHQIRERRWERLTARWQEPVLEALSDRENSAAVHELVEPKYRRHFVAFIVEYIRRVRGEERTTLRDLALPYLDGIVPLASHRRSEIRTRAIQTLGTLGLPTYSAQVLKGLDDPSPLVSMVAARYLARPDFPEFAEPILEHIDRFEGWNHRFLASMLAAIGPPVAPKLRERLADDEAPSWVRTAMADALTMQLDPGAADIAARIVVTTEDRELLAAVLRLLAAVGRPGHVTVVRARCSSPDEVIRAQALHALGMLSDEEDLPLLMRSMDDTSPWAALHAARGVREAGGREHLVRLTESDGPRAALAGQVLFEEDDT